MAPFKITLSFILLLFIFVACSGQEPVGPEDISGFSVSGDTLVVSSEANDYIIGRARAIATGPTDMLYVLDSVENNIKVLNNEGEFVREYLRGEGRGPGEVIAPASFDVDENGNVYVIDGTLNKVIILDADNEPINEFAFSMRPSRVLATHPDSVFIMGFRFTYQGDLVQRFTRNDNNDFEMTGSFGERLVDNRDMNFSGWADHIMPGGNGTIYLTQYYPYHVAKFDSDGNKLSEITREVEFITQPAMDMSAGMVLTTGLTREPLALANGMLLVRYQDRTDSDNPKSYFDLFDADGELISTHSFDELGIGNDLNNFISNPQTNTLYALGNEPFPFVKRFEVMLE